MLFEPNATQAQALLRLLFIPEEPAMSKFKPNLPADKRKTLVAAGLIALEKRGGANHVLLTDRGWAWAGENLDRLCPKSLNRLNPEILAAILGAVARNMTLRGLSLAELVRPEMFADGPATEAIDGAEAASSEAPAAAIRRTCNELTQTMPGGRIRLTELRGALPRIERSVLDATLIEMQASTEIVLSTLERFEIGAVDEAAAIHVAGLPRHVVFVKNI
ncbi:MAG: hypothetical protein HQ581_07670 [Planctomycetes bacterium]|nr:hypothetical protein [Planctomycetota bacterium]